MNCIVTAGPTYEPLDTVRRLTNFSTGRLATELANFLTKRGHEVTLLIGESATYSGEQRACTIQVFSTTEDLSRRLKELSGKGTGAIFHAAAVSDFRFGKLYTRNAGGEWRALARSKKISTRTGDLMVELKPTPKILTKLRGWFPKALLCGWKFEANGGRTEALRAARRQIVECETDYCVANGPAYGKGFCLVNGSEKRHFEDTEKLYHALGSLIQ